jgi:hypothetical protein
VARAAPPTPHTHSNTRALAALARAHCPAQAAIQQVRDELQDKHKVKTAYSDADLTQPPLIRDMVKQVRVPRASVAVCLSVCVLRRSALVGWRRR